MNSFKYYLEGLGFKQYLDEIYASKSVSTHIRSFGIEFGTILLNFLNLIKGINETIPVFSYHAIRTYKTMIRCSVTHSILRLRAMAA